MLPGERRQHVSVSATELEDPRAWRIRKTSVDHLENARLAVIEPEVSIPQFPQNSVTDSREIGLESGVAVHRG